MRETLDKAMDTQDVKIPQTKTTRREGLEIDLAWLAGIIDGEGNLNVGLFDVQSNKVGEPWRVFRLECVIVNTHAFMIEKVTRILAEIGVRFKVQVRDRKRVNWKPAFVITILGQGNTAKLLANIFPYLTAKQEIARQALLAFEYRKSLTRGGNNGFVRNHPRLQDDLVLNKMIERARELVRFRPDPFSYTRIYGQPISVKKPSETIRLTALDETAIRQESSQQ